MLLSLGLIVLITTIIVSFFVSIIKPRFAYYWLILTGGALATWLATLFQRRFVPLNLTLPPWQPQSFFPNAPVVILDTISWPFAFAISTILFSNILINVACSTLPNNIQWLRSGLFENLIMAAFSMVAVMAGNLLSLALTWAALDSLELCLQIARRSGQTIVRQIVIGFSGRMVSLIFVVWAYLEIITTGQDASVVQLTIQTALPLFLATGIRAGILPLFPISGMTEDYNHNQSFLILISIAPTLTIICRLSTLSEPLIAANLLLAAIGIFGFYRSLTWYNPDRERPAETDWMVVVSGLVLASALRLQPSASLSWGLALLLGGSLQFLHRIRSRLALSMPLIGIFFLTNLPGTPTWFSARLYSLPLKPVLMLFFLSHSLLLAGSLRSATDNRHKAPILERWFWVIYLWGLFLIILCWMLAAWWSSLLGFPPGPPTPNLIETTIVLLIVALSILLYWSRLWKSSTLLRITNAFRLFFNPLWLFRLVDSVHTLASKIYSLVTTLLESQAGILWAFLFLVFLISIFLQAGSGG